MRKTKRDFCMNCMAFVFGQTEPLFRSVEQNKKRQYEADYEKLFYILEQNQIASKEFLTKIDNWYIRLFQMGFLFHYIPCITHKDFSAGNMMFRGNRLYGVVDVGDFVVGDPDNDFLCLLDCSTDDFGKEFGRKVLYYYGHSSPELVEKRRKSTTPIGQYNKSCLGMNEMTANWLQKASRN